MVGQVQQDLVMTESQFQLGAAIKLLSGPTDEHKFAGLLMASKYFKSKYDSENIVKNPEGKDSKNKAELEKNNEEKLGPEKTTEALKKLPRNKKEEKRGEFFASTELNQIFNAVGIAFFRRLLKTKAAGCVISPCQSLATAVLATLCSSHDIARQCSQLAPDCFDILIQSTGAIDDATTCLLHFVSAGLNPLAGQSPGDILPQIASILSTVPSEARPPLASLFVHLLQTPSPGLLNVDRTLFSVARVFSIDQGSAKFTLLPGLLKLVQAYCASHVPMPHAEPDDLPEWVFDTREGLMDMLSSRASSSSRRMSFMITHCLSDAFGEAFLRSPAPSPARKDGQVRCVISMIHVGMCKGGGGGNSLQIRV